MQKGFITQAVILTVGLLMTLGIGLPLYLKGSDSQSLGSAPRVFTSDQEGTGATSGYYLKTDGTNSTWAAVSGGSGSSAISTSTSVSAGNVAIWTSKNTLSQEATGTLTESVAGLQLNNTRGLLGGSAALSLTSGYSIPTTTRMGTWDTAYSWGNHALAGYLTGVTANSPLSGAGTSASHLVLSTAGTWSGNASTASALAANGANCSAGSYPLGVNASGAVESCTVAKLGTVTSVALSTPTGLSISGSPITTSGTLALSYATGYAGVLTASTTNWNDFYNTPSTRITAGTNLSWSGNTLNATGGGGTSFTATTSIAVCASDCPYSSIQSALNAGYLNITLRPETYSEQVTIKNAKTKIIGAGTATVIQCNGSTQSPCISATNTSQTVLKDVKILESSGSPSGIGLATGDNPDSIFDNIRISGFATGTVMQDINNTSFYSSLTNFTLFDNVAGIEFKGTQANNNYVANIRCRQLAGYGGTCYTLKDVRGLGLHNIDAEPGTTGTTTGIHIASTSRDNNIYSAWVENNKLGVLVDSGATRNAFFGGSITSNTTDHTDNGTATQFLNVNETGSLLQRLAATTYTGNVTMSGTDLSLSGSSADILSDTDLDLYPGNQTTRSIRYSDNGSLAYMAETGSTEIGFGDNPIPISNNTYSLGISGKAWSDVYATLTHAIGLPISTGISGLATGIATFLGTPSSANLASALTDETGSGKLVFSASPTFTGKVTMANASTTALSATNLCLTGDGCITSWPSGSGGVTSVGMSVPTGLSISGTPITTSGTLALTYASGYGGVKTASTSAWNTFYTTPSNRITAGTGLSWSGNTLNASIPPQLPTYIVKGSGGGDFTTIQAALDACTSGCRIYLPDSEYDISSTLLIKGSNVFIEGNGDKTLIAGNGATVDPFFKTNTPSSGYGGFTLKNVQLYQTNATQQGTAIDASDMSLQLYDKIRVQSFGTGIRLNDTQGATLYNMFRNVRMYDMADYGINASSTLPANDNAFYDTRVACRANCTALLLNNANSNYFYSFNSEPSSPTGTIGIHILTESGASATFDNAFYGVYLEGNGYGLKIDDTSVQRTLVSGGTIVGNTTDVSDAGTDTSIMGVDVGYNQRNSVPDLYLKTLAGASAFLGVDTNGLIVATTTFGGTLTNATGLPLSSGVTGVLPTANGGTGTSSPVAFAITVASTSVAFASGGDMPIPDYAGAFTLSHIHCRAIGGTSVAIQIKHGGGSATESITCTTTGANDDGSITNASFTSNEAKSIDFGTVSGAVNYVVITAYK